MTADEHESPDILAALRMGVDYSFTIRARGLEVKVRPLSIAEHVSIVNDITAEMTEKPKNEQNGMTESALLAMRQLEKATTSEPGSKVAGKLTAHVMSKMTNDELIHLHRAYQAGCDILDPSAQQLTDDQLSELVEEAKKNLGALTGLPPVLLASIVRFLLTRDA